MRPSPEVLEKLRSEVSGLLTKDEEIVCAGQIGAAGLSMILDARREELQRRFPASFLAESPHETKGLSKICTDKAFVSGADAVICLGEGGFLAGLWKIAEASGTGLRIDLRRVPVDQHTIEICEFLELHPYMLYSEGAVIIGTKNGQDLTERFLAEGIPAAVIGHTTKDNDRLLKSGSVVSCLNRPAPDELYKICPDFRPLPAETGKMTAETTE